MDGIGTYVSSLEHLSSSHFDQLLRSTKPSPPQQLPRIHIPFYFETKTYKVHSSGDPGNPLCIEFEFNASAPCVVTVYWCVSKSALSKLMACPQLPPEKPPFVHSGAAGVELTTFQEPTPESKGEDDLFHASATRGHSNPQLFSLGPQRCCVLVPQEVVRLWGEKKGGEYVDAVVANAVVALRAAWVSLPCCTFFMPYCICLPSTPQIGSMLWAVSTLQRGGCGSRRHTQRQHPLNAAARGGGWTGGAFQ